MIEDLLGECRECNRLLRDCGQHCCVVCGSNQPHGPGRCVKFLKAERDRLRTLADAVRAERAAQEAVGKAWREVDWSADSKSVGRGTDTKLDAFREAENRHAKAFSAMYAALDALDKARA